VGSLFLSFVVSVGMALYGDSIEENQANLRILYRSQQISNGANNRTRSRQTVNMAHVFPCLLCLDDSHSEVGRHRVSWA